MAKKPSKKKSPAPEARTTPKAEAIEERSDEAAELDARADAADDGEVEATSAKATEEPARSEPARSEPARSEPARSETARSETVEPPAPKAAPESALGNLGWAVGVLLLGVGILALLAQLPPLE